MRAELAAAALLLASAGAAEEEAAPRVVLRWQSIPGAEGYDLQLSADPDFGRVELEQRVPLSGHRLGRPPAERRYWRVRSVDAEGRPGPWSLPKVIEPLASPEVAATQPLRLLEVPPPPPAPPSQRLADGPSDAPTTLPAPFAEREPAALPELPVPFPIGDVLREVRMGALLGWRANLLGVTAPELSVEASWPLPWLGERWGAALRAGWWRERATIPAAVGLASSIRATADVVPLAAVLHYSVPTGWARFYGAVGGGAHLVVVRLPDQGALEATAALVLAAGAGRRLGPGEAFAELGGTLGGVDGPLGKLRTGGLSLALGYRGAP